MIKRVLITFFLITLITISFGQVHDDDFDDGVTVEEVPDENLSNEIPYSSPEPLNKQSVYLAEHFDDINKYHKRWIPSEAKKDGIADEISKYDGIWKIEFPQKDPLPGDMGLVLKSKAKHAAISSKLERPFTFGSDSRLIVQYEVTFQDGQECGGAYLKLLSDTVENKDLKQFHDKTPYSIMFGPDKCGNDHKLHFIFRHKNPLNGSLEEKHCKKPKERLEDIFKDKMPHLYTLVLKSDNTFEILIDKKIINSGNLLEDFNPPVNPEREIDDPNDKKPDDWDEREKIPDPEAKKPEDWDETEPATITDPDAIKPDGWLDDVDPMIPDPEAKRPNDWDTEMDGEWEPPLIDNPICTTAIGCGKWEPPTISNPLYKGKWRPPMIDNPNYKGKWRPKKIPNPDYYEDLNPFQMTPISAVGFELWSMSSDILFDNIIVTDDLAVANQWSIDTFDLKRKKIAREAESVLQRLLMYAEENPWLWSVYIIAVGLPIVLIVFCCCKTSDNNDLPNRRPESADATGMGGDGDNKRTMYDSARAASIKKTDAPTQDDDNNAGDYEDDVDYDDNDDETGKINVEKTTNDNKTLNDTVAADDDDDDDDEDGDGDVDEDNDDDNEDVAAAAAAGGDAVEQTNPESVPEMVSGGFAPRKRKVRKE